MPLHFFYVPHKYICSDDHCHKYGSRTDIKGSIKDQNVHCLITWTEKERKSSNSFREIYQYVNEAFTF